MKRQYTITINGEAYLYDLTILQAYWIAAALFVAGFWHSYKRVRVVNQGRQYFYEGRDF